MTADPVASHGAVRGAPHAHANRGKEPLRVMILWIPEGSTLSSRTGPSTYRPLAGARTSSSRPQLWPATAEPALDPAFPPCDGRRSQSWDVHDVRRLRSPPSVTK